MAAFQYTTPLTFSGSYKGRGSGGGVGVRVLQVVGGLRGGQI
ncbi:hypothetical protein HanRHA438_Chr15g0722141 [Helianthus annuus]|nr:hypothetical protein HanRHA438_Chr15g0722141 [Helianthus annuus]